MSLKNLSLKERMCQSCMTEGHGYINQYSRDCGVSLISKD
jgi:hypothetical protein